MNTEVASVPRALASGGSASTAPVDSRRSKDLILLQQQPAPTAAVTVTTTTTIAKPTVSLALDDDEDHPELVQMMTKAEDESAALAAAPTSTATTTATTAAAAMAKHADQHSNDGDDEEEDSTSRPDTAASGTPRVDAVPVEMLTEEELKDRILKQIDFYFGDANFPKDKYLRKQARLDPSNEDWISLEVITHYKKVKKLTSDPALVAAAVQGSSVVVLSNDRTKLRRINPIPKDVEDTLARTVVLENLPRKTTEAILKAICEGHGAVAAVRIYDPSAANAMLPEDIKAMLAIGQAEGRNVMHSALLPGRPPVGLVEYQTHNDANKACKSLAVENEWARALRVTRLYKKEKELQGQTESASDSERRRPGSTTNSGSYRSRSRNEDDAAHSESGRSSGRSVSPYMDVREVYRPRAHSAGISSSNWRQVTPAGTTTSAAAASALAATPGSSTSNNMAGAGLPPRDRAVSLGRRMLAPSSRPTPSALSGGLLPTTLATPAVTATSASSGCSSTSSSTHGTPSQQRRIMMTPTNARSSPAEAMLQQQQQQQQPGQSSSAANWRSESPALRSASPMLRTADTVIRQPKGPEGKGFTAMRQRTAEV